MITTQAIIMAATIRASNKGLEIIDEARCKKGWTKADEVWVGLVPTSIPTLKRFWAGIAVQTETFQRICEVVGINDWESIADFEVIDKLPSNISAKRLSFAIAGSIENIDKHKLDAIVALLQKLGGDTSIEILDIDEGSIKLILGGSPGGLKKIEALFNSGELPKVSGILVQNVHFLKKVEQAQLIKKNGGSALFLSGIDLSGTDLYQTDLKSANLSEADLIGANLSRANLTGANLSDAILIRANLSYANVSRANLSKAYLTLAGLIGANLSEANLSRASLSKAILIRANLSEANLSRANLSEANLRGANLTGANLILAGLIGANLSEANLIRANLSEADLRGANLSKARFSNNLGLSDTEKADMKKRGAIFDDSSESDVPSFVNR